MRAPFRLFLHLPDGTEYPVSSIYFRRDGTIMQITTVPDRPFGEYYAIEDDELTLDGMYLVVQMNEQEAP